MLNLPIESEIEAEHKVFREFNLRQTICIGITCVAAIIMYLIFRNWMLMVAFSAPFALVLLFFAKPGENGEKAEDIIRKSAERHYYRNQTRSYRTKNRYVALMNREYRRLAAEDQKDPKRVRKLRQAQKRREKRRRRTSCRGYN